MEDQKQENQEQNSVNEGVTENKEESQAKTDETVNTEETDKTADLQKEIDELKQKCETMHNDYLRLYADFENYKKRTLKEKSELIKSAGENIFTDLLPLIDDFERAEKAMKEATEVDAVKEGMQLIYNKFVKFLEQKGVKEIQTEAQGFDTDFHEAIAKIPAPTDDLKGKVIDCTQKGYTLNEKVIRYAKVVVGE